MTKILVAQGVPQLVNVGDIAMCQVALTRLRHLWPASTFLVLTDNPARLAHYYPQTTSASWPGLCQWSAALLGRHARRLPPAIYARFERIARYQLPAVGNLLLQQKLRLQPGAVEQQRAFQRAMAEADIVVATGGGFLTDEFPAHCLAVLRCLEWASRLKKPTFMFGQGMGPLTNPQLRTAAQAILPRVDLITLREKNASLPLLRALNVSEARVVVTGDDAIELAYEKRSHTLGSAIGVNLRIARYSGVTVIHRELVGTAICTTASQLKAPLIPLPISSVDDDQQVIAQMLKIVVPLDAESALPTPLAVIAAVSRCRVVVTGSYHAAVFALAQGIPVVGLAKSPYYFDKFDGLAEQFGLGCQVLNLDDHQLSQKLTAALTQAWDTAEQTRAPLLAAARRQMAAGEQAYAHAREIFEKKV